MRNNIKELRKNRKLRQEDLAEKLGVTRQTIIAIENNKYDPTLELAMKISAFFGVSVNEIFHLEKQVGILREAECEDGGFLSYQRQSRNRKMQRSGRG